MSDVGQQQETPRRLRRAEEVRFTISIAAEMVNVHAQTLRHYERIGLIAPKRSEGKIRYYTLEDIERLDMIKHLMEQEDVNLAGVKAVLRLQQQVETMRADYERQVQALRESYEAEIARLKNIIRRMNSQNATPQESILR
ncbi:MAG TPA: MerR family transcriptional regulator [Chloroflexota bacterium]|nr:MerR family transcriptional regulator [Chloroflexota bacterium]